MRRAWYNKHMQYKSKRGFTIIELSLSIVFIAILSIAIVLVIMNAVSSYHRGLTLNKINTVGMDLVDDMRLAIQSSPARLATGECAAIYSKPEEKAKCEASNGQNFVLVKKSAKVTVKGTNQEMENVPVYGAFCTGLYSYIWNSGYYFNKDFKVDESAPSAEFEYKMSDSGNQPPITNFKLLKVKDDERRVCISAADANANGKYDAGGKDISNVFNITDYQAIDEAPTDILSAGEEGVENNMAIYDLYAMPPVGTSKRNNVFYSVSFILGTVQGGINVMASGDYCATPASYSSAENFDYCAINKFNFAAQATGG